MVKMFRKSPTKNDDVLQKHVKQKLAKELSLLLDCKTRWTSLHAMLEPFVKVKNCIRKSLTDTNSSVTFTDDEFKLIADTVLALQPVKVAVEALC